MFVKSFRFTRVRVRVGSEGYLALAFWMPAARLAAFRSKTNLMSSCSSSRRRLKRVSRLW